MPPHMSVIVDRIDQRLKELGLSREAASKLAGKNRDFIRNIAKNPDKPTIPRGDNLIALASVLQCSPQYILGQESEVGVAPVKIPYIGKILAIRCRVEAGLWRELEEIDEPLGMSDVPEDQRFAGIDQWLEIVTGDSMDLMIPSGAMVHVVDAIQLGYAPTGGHIVVVERRRGNTRERTLKQIERSKDGVKLWPRSSNPRWQEPIQLLAGTTEDEVEVEIVGLVVQDIRKWA
jgi:transcriptional regulator with XRE-family HTH domain